MLYFPKATLLTSLTTLILTSTLTAPSLANSQSFFCGTSQGTYATKVRTSQGNKPILYYRNWAQRSGWTAQRRCQEVSKRFQSFYAQNRLNYLKAGQVNSHPVVCVTPNRQVSCNSRNLLFTLEPGTNPQTVLNNLISVSKGNSSGGIGSSVYIDSQTLTLVPSVQQDAQGNPYIEIDQLIEATPVESTND